MMNPKTIIAVVLIAFSIVVLAYSGISCTTKGKPVEFLGMHFETTKHHFIPPVPERSHWPAGSCWWWYPPSETES